MKAMADASPKRTRDLGILALVVLGPDLGLRLGRHQGRARLLGRADLRGAARAHQRRPALPRHDRAAQAAAPAAAGLHAPHRPPADDALRRTRDHGAARRRRRQGLGAHLHDAVLAAAARLDLPRRTAARRAVARRRPGVRRPRPRRAAVGHGRRRQRRAHAARRVLLGGERAGRQAPAAQAHGGRPLADDVADGVRLDPAHHPRSAHLQRRAGVDQPASSGDSPTRSSWPTPSPGSSGCTRCTRCRPAPPDSGRWRSRSSA